jgi:RNA polymerase sigma factor (sigma-70 family)
MSSIQGNDNPEFSSWLEDNYSHVLKMSLFFTRNRTLAEDIAQEASVKIMKAWSNPDQCQKFLTSTSYLNETVKNTFLDHRRAESRRPKNDVPFDEHRDSQSSESYDHELREAILVLPEDQLTVILLKYRKYTEKEIADELGLSRDQVKRIYQKAKESLAKLLKEEG